MFAYFLFLYDKYIIKGIQAHNCHSTVKGTVEPRNRGRQEHWDKLAWILSWS